MVFIQLNSIIKFNFFFYDGYPYSLDTRVHRTNTYHSDINETIDSMGSSPVVSEKKKKKRRMDGRNCCCRCLCCACCLPVWGTYIAWFIVGSIIIVVIVLGIIAATFKMPTIDMAGITSNPNNGSQISFNLEGFSINFGLIVAVNNPNIVDIRLSEMNAIAYYPDQDGSGRSNEVGTGYLDKQFIPRKTDFKFTFPFSLHYNPNLNRDQSVLNDIAERCGLTGLEKQDITISYSITFKATVLFISIRPTISSSTTIACPLDVSHILIIRVLYI
ncbi:hypothetical protein BDB01DRAFT_790966 [Pilobolus umbonatus]|nr:hypothetical protein BDB01DRAFT_790966 [Pilobolus umbonatus]